MDGGSGSGSGAGAGAAAGTGNPVRDTQFATWKDELAPLERMRGAAWTAAIAEEQAAYAAATSLTAVRSRVQAARRELEKGIADKQQYFFKAAGGKIEIAPGHGGAYMWKYAGERVAHGEAVRDIVADMTHVWTVVDVGAGAERLELRCASHAAPGRILWRRAGVGPSIAVRAGRCYYTLTANIHRGYVAESADAYDGGDRRQLVKISDDRWNVHIMRCYEAGATFIQAEDSGHFKLWDADGHPLDHKSKVQVVAGDYKEKAAWFADGKPAGSIASWPVPAATKESILWALPSRGWLATHMFGKTRIYKWGPSILRRAYTLRTGQILLDSWSTWESATGPVTAVVFAPDQPIHTLLLGVDGRITRPETNPFRSMAPALGVRDGMARSADGTTVPFKVVGLLGAGGATPRGLLVYGYGAYGIPTAVGRPWALWGPLLARGWAVAYGMVRGGGDGDSEWADAARLGGRMRAVEDFEAVVRAARRVTGVPAGRTVISGRSAGGLIVGALVARHGGGDLFGAAFAEVPYVDLLRTTTNPDLALTTVEYNEFGDPVRRIVDFVTALGVSPIDQVVGRGAPGVFVLARTGGNDTQVYPYEPLKWVRRLREGPTPAAGKLLGYAPDEGHFYSPAADLAARSTDLALLDAWVDSPVVRKKIAAISITTQMANMRKNNMRKSRKNNMRKSRKTEGGKRRKARATRKARKTRRTSRK
jgi:hypothetical protein